MSALPLPLKRTKPPDEWWELRRQVLRHYGRACMCCGDDQTKVHIDHIIPVCERPDLELAFDNLQVLCWRCNTRKGHRHATDYRPCTQPT